MKINRFMSHIDSMARQNRFEARIFGPRMEDAQGLKNVSTGIRGMRVSKATIPGRKITTESYSEIPGGPKRKYLQAIEYDQEVTLTFITDNTLEDRQMIETWMESMYDWAYGVKYLYDTDAAMGGYTGTVVLTQLDRGDLPIYEVELIQAFPETLTGFSLDTSSSAIQTFDVTFGYHHWTSSFENSPSNSILGELFRKAGRKLKSKVKQKVEDKVFKERGSLASKLGID